VTGVPSLISGFEGSSPGRHLIYPNKPHVLPRVAILHQTGNAGKSKIHKMVSAIARKSNEKSTFKS
jgi:hypothetical protein